MPQTSAAGFRGSDHDASAPPPALATFDPLGEIAVTDHRRPARGAFDPPGEIRATDHRGPARGAFDPPGEIRATDSRAAARAAMADQFAARFGLDELGPSAEAIADRYDFRYEGSETDPALPAGRRTVTITGRGAERAIPPAERSLPRGSLPRAGRAGRRPATRRTTAVEFRGDRVALWAVALALLLAFVAATSAHAATLGLLH